jgi:hypothetical protein
MKRVLARTRGAERARRRFLRHFPRGFRDRTYLEWERHHKDAAHEAWLEELGHLELERLIHARAYDVLAARAVRIEEMTSLLFSFEKLALRDAIAEPEGARAFSEGLHQLLYGADTLSVRFERWCEAIAAMPRKQSRVLSWPAATVFGMLAQPRDHIFFKPGVTQVAAERWGFPLAYHPRPGWAGYQQLLAFAASVRRDIRDLGPRDMFDVQSFLWVLGSDEYD